jgi:hypothetical protein
MFAWNFILLVFVKMTSLAQISNMGYSRCIHYVKGPHHRLVTCPACCPPPQQPVQLAAKKQQKTTLVSLPNRLLAANAHTPAR